MKSFPFFLLCILIISCKSLPEERLYQFESDVSYEVKDSTLIFKISNPLKCPLSIHPKSKHQLIKNILVDHFPIFLPAESDSILSFPISLSKKDFKIKFSITFGNPADTIIPNDLSLPFPSGKKYKIIQGYNGSFSHSSDYSRYAIDFNLQIGDTICAADDGFVVGVIEDYLHGGSSKKWKNYANFITIYHPKSNLFTQYVHLKNKGSFVEVGDEVKMRQAIAISGETGFTSTPHLHFNVLKRTAKSMISTKTIFMEGYDGIDLTEGEFVEK